MKNNYPLLILFALALGSTNLAAQGSYKKLLNSPATLSKVTKELHEEVKNENPPARQNQHSSPALPVSFRSTVEVPVGVTQYDLQTNSSMQTRIINHGDGTLSATWTMSREAGATAEYLDRGTGYNYFDGTEWGTDPTARLEQSRRTGWPSLVTTTDGKDLITNHFSPSPYTINTLLENGSSWTEKDIRTRVPKGVLWNKSAIGGPDGNTVHMVALSSPTGTSTEGEIYKGMDGHLLYYRSTNGGVSWDKTDIIIPGIDSTRYAFLSADGYAIDASGNTVALLVMSGWGDIVMAKSLDNGETWDIQVIYDFPLGPAYDLDGYDVSEVPQDTITTEGNAIRSTDESGAILIDNDGMVHVWYSEVWVGDSDFTDRSWVFYPGINSINYWNESMGENNFVELTGIQDDDGNGTFDVGTNEYGNYSQGFASYPTVGIDAAGNLYLAYAAISETYFNENSNPGLQHYRHIYVITSKDGGETWTPPYDIINPTLSEPFFYEFTEAMFPSMARLVDDHVHILYQQDYEPGLMLPSTATNADNDDIEDNYIYYSPVPVTLLEPTSSHYLPGLEDFKLEVTPNPFRDNFVVNFDLSETEDVSIDVYNLYGQHITNLANGTFGAGNQQVKVEVNNLSTGMYILKLQAGNSLNSTKIVVQ